MRGSYKISILMIICCILLTGCFSGSHKSGKKYVKNALVYMKAYYFIDFEYSRVIGKNDDGSDILELYPKLNPDIKFNYQQYIIQYPFHKTDKYNVSKNYEEVLWIKKYADVYQRILGKPVNTDAIWEAYQKTDFTQTSFLEFLRTTDYVISIPPNSIPEFSQKIYAMSQAIAEFPEISRVGGRRIDELPYQFENQKDLSRAYFLSNDFSFNEETTLQQLTQHYQYMKDTGELK
ncbi:hypothetical protein [Paenibacillus sp. FSL L8-0708]|uniref:hypothetical protein n=1 Tax=Paenibacillus sp. FSL L8-0708 TaxID=2975311 RepID=UPI0030F515B3